MAGASVSMPREPSPVARAAPPLRLAVVELAPFGGLLHYAVQLSDALAALGHEVDLVVPAGNELEHRSGAARRRAVLPRGLGPPGADPGPLAVLGRRAKSAAHLLRSWRTIIALARSEDYDAVVLNGSFDLLPSVWAARTLLRLAPATAITHVCHNVRPFNRWGGEELFLTDERLEKGLRRLYARFDRVFVHGERSRSEFDRLWPGARVSIIPHGDERVFGDRPPPPSSEQRALFFGDWRRVKGLDVLMESFSSVWLALPDACLTIAGSPSPEEGGADAVLAWAAARPAQVDVQPGYVPLEEVPDLFGRARVVVLPYRVGYQSGVLHLAMTMGRAVVVTDVGDLSDVVTPGVTGIVVPPQDPEALAAALVKVLGDADLAASLGAAGHLRMQDGSDWQTVAATMVQALQADIQRR